MAKIDSDFDFATRYPWNQWLDGKTWRLTPGVDFVVEIPVFRSIAYKAASRRRGIVSTAIDAGEVVLKFQPTEPTENIRDA